MPAGCYVMDINAEYLCVNFPHEIDEKKNPSEIHRPPNLFYYDGVGAGPQLPSSLMGFDYQYLNKLPIYHVEAPATGKKSTKTVKLKMKNDDGQSVCLCLVGVARVRISIDPFSLSYFPAEPTNHTLPASH